MFARFRPIHCGFETLRHASDVARSSQSYRRLGAVANEQMTARGTGTAGRVTRPTAIFVDFRER